ncbi:hypothetical protein F01_480130 [Burkholderia cenocepacia]|nr:hypothetical protein F01_480130 [Burkholderia cenocepacia]
MNLRQIPIFRKEIREISPSIVTRIILLEPNQLRLHQ